MINPTIDPARKILDYTTMLFDPNRESAKITRSAFQRAGILEMKYHLDVEAAKVYVKESKPQLVIVDLSPDVQKHSIDLMRSIRIKMIEDAPRIIALLGTGAPEGLKTAITNGADIAIIKPLIPEIIFKKTKMIMEAPQNYIKVKGYFGPDPKRLSKKAKKA